MTATIVFDIDGTLADDSWRLDQLPAKVNDVDDDYSAAAWDAYYEAGRQDGTLLCGVSLFQGWVHHRAVYPALRIVCATGRPERFRRLTEEWLGAHGLWPEALFMRSDSDRRTNSETKVAHARAIGLDEINVWYDDNPKAVEALREVGVPAAWLPNTSWSEKWGYKAPRRASMYRPVR